MEKNRIAEVRKLHLKKFREEEKRFVVEGTKSVLDLFRSDLKTIMVAATADWLERNGTLVPPAAEVFPVSDKELERLTCLKNAQKVLAVAESPAYTVDVLHPDEPILMLDGISDPGNMGTIIRTADWFGIAQIVCSPDTVEFTNPKVVQASMGSFSRIRVVYADLCDFLKNQGGRAIYGTFMNGNPIQSATFHSNDILIIGNEGNGISKPVEDLVTERIHIPSCAQTKEKAESLNAALSTAILLYQFRQIVG